MGKVTLVDLTAKQPPKLQLRDLEVGQAAKINQPLYISKCSPIEPGIYIKTKVATRDLTYKNDYDWYTFFNVATGETRFIPCHVECESVDLKIHFARAK